MSLAFAVFEEKSRLKALLDHFSTIDDPREPWRVAHPLPEVLLLVVCGTMADCDDYDDIAAWGETHLAFLRRYLPYEHGVPGGRWLTLLMNRINPALFSAAFTAWVRETWPDRPDLIAIDGKTSRRSHDRADDKGPLHLVSAFATTSRLVLGQEAVEGKSQRTFGDPRSARAAGRRRRAERRARLHRRHRHQRQDRADDQGRRRRLSARRQSQPADPARGDGSRLRRGGSDRHLRRPRQGPRPHRTADGQRHQGGRLARRRAALSRRIAPAARRRRSSACNRAPSLPTAAASRRATTSPRPCSRPSRPLGAVRGHWGIENRLHWVLDVVFAEDQSRLRKGHGAKNMAVVRHFAINLVRAAKDKKSIKLRRKIAGLGPKLLG